MDLIVGAGLAGLLAAHAWPRASLIDAAPAPREEHKALLRFRTEAVSQLTGVEFRKVRVSKGIFSEGRFVEPNVRVANLYSRKVLGDRLADRSIWNIAPVDRYIAPEDFYEQLISSVGSRISWGTPYEQTKHGAAISTMPMPSMLKTLGIPFDVTFGRCAVKVMRLRIPNADVFQTIYFPDEDTPLYRASITKDLLIAELVGAMPFVPGQIIDLLQIAFGISISSDTEISTSTQSYGKITPIPDDWRKRAMFDLSHQHGIYSLGRFACWRNILLDDVVNDIVKIKQLLKTSGAYDLWRATT